MSLKDIESLDRLCALLGIGTDYSTPLVRQKILIALGYPVADDAAVKKILNEEEKSPYRTPLPRLKVLRDNRRMDVEITIQKKEAEKPCRWVLTEEDGEIYHGVLPLKDSELLEEKEIDGVTLQRRRFRFPIRPAFGYHRFGIETPGGKEAEMLLIYAPEECYFPPSIENGERTWGVPAQLYAMRSETNWGIGDFTDVGNLGRTLADNGAGIFGISPIHAMFINRTHEASPYCPASRTFFNHIYLDVTAVPDFAFSEAGQEEYKSEDFQKKLKEVQEFDYVDYTTTLELKTRILRKLYATFRQNELGEQEEGYLTERGKEFRHFCENGGGPLERFAAFQALSVHFSDQAWWWKEWPEEYQDPYNENVQQYTRENREDVDFYKYLQWETVRQVGEASRSCQEGGMAVGLYMDLAVGVSLSSAEVWAEPDLYAKNVAAGSPSDVLRENGVDWGLVPMKPRVLYERDYKPFIRMLRSNMQHAGCLRMDHVFQLRRLFLIAHELEGFQGEFVDYPVEDLMSIVALESHRNMCMVIGEDLGRFPEGFRDQMEDQRILSYRVLPFERYPEPETKIFKAYRDPHEYPRLAVAATSTHDTPTLSGQWTLHQTHEKDFMGFFISEEQRNEAFRKGAENRAYLNDALTRSRAWQKVGATPSTSSRSSS